MVDRTETIAPADLRFILVKNVAGLAQLDDAKLPDGARAIVLDEDPAAGAPNGSGAREFVYTRLAPPDSPALTFAEANGAFGTPTRNAYLAKSGALWIQWPQIYLVTLNGTTPVTVSDVITIVGGTGPSGLAQLNWRRSGVTTSAGTVLFTPGDNAFDVVSDDANDDGPILVQYFSQFVYP